VIKISYASVLGARFPLPKQTWTRRRDKHMHDVVSGVFSWIRHDLTLWHVRRTPLST